MRRIRTGVAAALLLGVLATAVSASTHVASADDRQATRLVAGSFLLDPAGVVEFRQVVRLVFEADLTTTGGTALTNRDVFFSAGGQQICRAVTDVTGRASCTVLRAANLGTILAVLTGSALVEYRGNELYQPATVIAPAFGRGLPPPGCGFICG